MSLNNVEHDIPDLNNIGYKMVERDNTDQKFFRNATLLSLKYYNS